MRRYALSGHLLLDIIKNILAILRNPAFSIAVNSSFLGIGLNVMTKTTLRLLFFVPM
jgi:hypothetical protein